MIDQTTALILLAIAVWLILFGYILGRLARPKVYHGHLTEVGAQKPKSNEKELHEKLPKINEAFNRKRVTRAKV